MSNCTLHNHSISNEQRRTARDRLESLAKSSIAISQLAPALSDIAAKLSQGAQEQANQSKLISMQADRMTQELLIAIEGLRNSSNSVHEIVGTIKRVADQTKILSINASIEAARAGSLGAAFGVVAHEVELLATQTMTATDRISTRVEGIRENIHDAVSAAGLLREPKQGSNSDNRIGIGQLSFEVSRIAGIATDNAHAADGVHSTSTRIRSLCEDLLLNIGTFRLSAHQRAADIFLQILHNHAFTRMDRFQMESLLRNAAAEHPIFELFYVTDATGRQITANIWTDGRDGASQLHANWSQRSWFTSTCESEQLHISDIYRSTATDNFCFTLAAPIFSPGGSLAGVLAADINFAELIAP